MRGRGVAAEDVAKESGAKVVAVGCLAERYGAELAESLPEADAVLGFDAYPDLAARLADVLGGHAPAAHVPVDRRTLLPISPVQRPAAVADVAVPGLDRVRVSYLQPAELRPDLLTTIATTPGVAPYFDLSFQHSSAAVLRRMRRFGSTTQFLDLCDRIRALAPAAGIRSNVIVGFPGETDDDVAELEEFLTAARLDAVGVFGYSDEEGTEAAGYDGKVPAEEVAARVSRIAALVDELMAQRAEDRVGTEVTVLVEQAEDDDFECTGRAEHQAPEVDGECVLERGSGLQTGDLVRCVVTGTEGADLQVAPREVLPRRGAGLVGAGAS